MQQSFKVHSPAIKAKKYIYIYTEGNNAAMAKKKQFSKICSLTHKYVMYIDISLMKDQIGDPAVHHCQVSTVYIICLVLCSNPRLKTHFRWPKHLCSSACSEIEFSSWPGAQSTSAESLSFPWVSERSKQQPTVTSREQFVKNVPVRPQHIQTGLFVHVLGFELHPWHSVWPWSGSLGRLHDS